MTPTSFRPWLRVLGIAGSLRRDSYNRGLITRGSRARARWHRGGAAGDGPHPALQRRSSHGDPKSAERLKQAIAEADALLVATPEYNRGIPSPLKNANDADQSRKPPGRQFLIKEERHLP